MKAGQCAHEQRVRLLNRFGMIILSLEGLGIAFRLVFGPSLLKTTIKIDRRIKGDAALRPLFLPELKNKAKSGLGILLEQE